MYIDDIWGKLQESQKNMKTDYDGEIPLKHLWSAAALEPHNVGIWNFFSTW
jgi:hypothetical protein